MIYSTQKRAALTRQRWPREKAERAAELYVCDYHPEMGAMHERQNLQCEGCIRDGFILRVTHIRPGLSVITTRTEGRTDA